MLIQTQRFNLRKVYFQSCLLAKLKFMSTRLQLGVSKHLALFCFSTRKKTLRWSASFRRLRRRTSALEGPWVLRLDPSFRQPLESCKSSKSLTLANKSSTKSKWQIRQHPTINKLSVIFTNNAWVVILSSSGLAYHQRNDLTCWLRRSRKPIGYEVEISALRGKRVKTHLFNLSNCSRSASECFRRGSIQYSLTLHYN